MEPEVLPPPGPSATIVHKQFNSPVGLYSADNIADAFKGQVEGMGLDAGATKYSIVSYKMITWNDWLKAYT